MKKARERKRERCEEKIESIRVGGAGDAEEVPGAAGASDAGRLWTYKKGEKAKTHAERRRGEEKRKEGEGRRMEMFAYSKLDFQRSAS